jgi:hypothetical protein
MTSNRKTDCPLLQKGVKTARKTNFRDRKMEAGKKRKLKLYAIMKRNIVNYKII